MDVGRYTLQAMDARRRTLVLLAVVGVACGRGWEDVMGIGGGWAWRFMGDGCWVSRNQGCEDVVGVDLGGENENERERWKRTWKGEEG